MQKDSAMAGEARPKAKGARKSRKSAPGRANAKAKPIGNRKGGHVAVVSGSKTASRLIDQRIRGLAGWRGETLTRMRALILEADPEMTEEWKWRAPVWSRHGIVCTGRRTRRS